MAGIGDLGDAFGLLRAFACSTQSGKPANHFVLKPGPQSTSTELTPKPTILSFGLRFKSDELN